MSAEIPDDLPVVREQRTHEEGRVWLARLPGLLAAAAERWDLELGPPFRAGSAAWAGPARRRSDGTECVLKLTLPHREARFEGDGLLRWDGDGAVRLLAQEPEEYALVVERCRPGTDLHRDPAPTEDRLVVGAELLRRLWSAPVPDGRDGAPFERVADVCAEWAGLVRARMAGLRPAIDPGLVELGASLLESLPATATRSVLVHGDFNPTNILRAERDPWLAIDAKPMVGDPGYDPWPLVGQVGEPIPDARLGPHFAIVADVVGEPVERLLAWAVARTVESALWNASRGNDPSDEMRLAGVLARLAGL